MVAVLIGIVVVLTGIVVVVTLIGIVVVALIGIVAVALIGLIGARIVPVSIEGGTRIGVASLIMITLSLLGSNVLQFWAERRR